jgi:hypothetical protein
VRQKIEENNHEKKTSNVQLKIGGKKEKEAKEVVQTIIII